MNLLGDYRKITQEYPFVLYENIVSDWLKTNFNKLPIIEVTSEQKEFLETVCQKWTFTDDNEYVYVYMVNHLIFRIKLKK